MNRFPAVSGKFYPAEPKALTQALEQYIVPGLAQPVMAALVPHAGYIYSGKTAGKVYGQLDLSDTVLILGPNHYGLGADFALMAEGVWTTPLGEVSIDTELACHLLENVPEFVSDSEAHLEEHAIEVQLPFLQHLKPSIRFVPVSVGTHDQLALEAAGEHLALALKTYHKRILILVSGDMNHYESEPITRRKDKQAIECLGRLDVEALRRAVKTEQISMCGFAPASVVLKALLALGALRGQLVDYSTSGEESGDRESVVGYAGMIFV